MKRVSRTIRAAGLRGGLVGLALLSSQALTGCADDGLATLKVALSVDAQRSFELMVFKGSPPADLSGPTAFNSGCQARRSTVLELSDLPVGDDYSIVYKAYADTTCSGAPIAFGFRGGIAVTKGDAMYVHVPVYETGAGTLLPADLNLSSLAATPTASCDAANVCGDVTTSDCVTSGGKAWCVPVCASDANCASLHSEATCDVATRWCMLESPWPLNASEPRLFGRAMTRPDGDVVVVGGLTPVAGGKLGLTKFPVERFDAARGIFGSYDLAGFDGRPGASFGFAELGADRAVVAGGISAADRFAVGSGLVANGRADGVDKAFVIDFASGRASSASLGRVVIDPAVFVIDSNTFWVAGGHEGRAENAAAGATLTSICTVDGAGTLTCADGPRLATARIGAAIMCATDTNGPCERALVIGGNTTGGPVAELVELSGQEIAVPVVDAPGLPAVLMHPVFCGGLLVGGGTPDGPASAIQLDLSGLADGQLSVVGSDEAAAPVPRWAGHAADGCGLVAGGISGTQSRGDQVSTATAASFVAEPGTLGAARLGAAVARIGAGPLAGSWLVLGGSVLEGGSSVITGAEVWRP